MKFVVSIEVRDEAETCTEIAEQLHAIARAIAAEGDVELWICCGLPPYKPKRISVRDQIIGTWWLEP